jgi:hypothetical protein
MKLNTYFSLLYTHEEKESEEVHCWSSFLSQSLNEDELETTKTGTVDKNISDQTDALREILDFVSVLN